MLAREFRTGASDPARAEVGEGDEPREKHNLVLDTQARVVE